MENYPNILMIGGNIRNSGKTTLACALIRKFSHRRIIGLKVTSIYPDDKNHHGSHPENDQESWEFTEETNRTGEKDTSRMLKAGAEKVYYIRSNDSFLNEAWNHFKMTIGEESLVICESRSLIKIVKPGIFILMIRENGYGDFKDMSEYLPTAGLICHEGNKADFTDRILSRISIEENSWLLDEIR